MQKFSVNIKANKFFYHSSAESTLLRTYFSAESSILNTNLSLFTTRSHSVQKVRLSAQLRLWGSLTFRTSWYFICFFWIFMISMNFWLILINNNDIWNCLFWKFLSEKKIYLKVFEKISGKCWVLISHLRSKFPIASHIGINVNRRNLYRSGSLQFLGQQQQLDLATRKFIVRDDSFESSNSGQLRPGHFVEFASTAQPAL